MMGEIILAVTHDRVLREAFAAFLAVLDGYTLEDLLAKRIDMLSLFAPQAA